MRIIRSFKYVSFPDRPVYLTLGNFDGLHLGHRAIIEKMVSEAQDSGGISVLFTFIRHPLCVLAPSKNPMIITPFKKKMSLLKTMGVQWVICLRFTRQFANISAEEFIEKIIHKKLRAKKIFTGPTYFFGKNRRGASKLLKAEADQFGYEVEVLDAVYVGDMISSSTNIRGRINSGEVDQAQALLGRPYSIQGRVVHGTQKGKDLGIHTATLRTRSNLMPADGVYMVYAEVSGNKHLGLVNIGCQPTFGSNRRAVEVHILKFNEDIYGEPMEIHFVKRIRDEKRFESVNALREQIEEDIRSVTAAV